MKHLIFVLFLVVLATTVFGVSTSLTLVPNQYNLVLNAFQQDVPLEAVPGTTKRVLEWVPYKFPTKGGYDNAVALAQGKGYFVQTDAASMMLEGTYRTEISVDVLNNQPAYFVIGTLQSTATPLSDFVIVDGTTQKSFLDGSGVYYERLLQYNPGGTPRWMNLALESGTMLAPGVGYFLRALKPFRLKLKGAAPTTGFCASDADVGKIASCAVTEEQYLKPFDSGYQYINQERDMQKCQKVGTEFKLIADKCPVGTACRTDVSGSSCKPSTPPPFKDPVTGAIIGPRQ
ncbi:hypothetical protein HY639_03865 [Candidatus Woesearchaeota archaeon]|nr:hypothetical protein [Candidatus Woesearchaeota archaeon]